MSQNAIPHTLAALRVRAKGLTDAQLGHEAGAPREKGWHNYCIRLAAVQELRDRQRAALAASTVVTGPPAVLQIDKGGVA